MSEYSMTCSCGDVMKVQAGSKDEAAQKLGDMLTPEAVEAHMKEKHPGQPVPSQADVQGMIEQGVQPA